MSNTISIANLPTGTPSTDDILVFVDRADWVTKRANQDEFPASWDVSSAAVIADNAIVRGDGWAKWVQSSGTSISDVNNISANNYFSSSATTASDAWTTILTVASARIQNLTGATTQTFQLPDATTLALSSVFEFNNNSSGSLTITNAGAVSQYVVPAGGAVIVLCTSIGTANGTWDFHALAPLSVTWWSGIVWLVMNSVLSTSPSVASWASSATVPSFIPQRGASTTGFGGDGTSLFGIVWGFARFAINATGIGFANVANTFTSYFSNTATASRTWTFPDANTFIPIISQLLTFSWPTAARTITLPDANFTVARTDAANTFTGVQTTTQVLSTNNAITATANAATVPVTHKLSTVTNNSAATLTITLTTAGVIDGQLVMVRVLDFSAVAQTVAWVNTENWEGTAFTTSNGSTTLPRTAWFQYNSATSKWRCLTN